MNIEDYCKKANIAGFEERPLCNTGFEVSLQEFIDFDNTDIELKLYLNNLIIRRSFYGTYTAWYKDVEWFIRSFFKTYSLDIIKPELTETIKEAATMILSEEVFTKQIIGTTFMFGVIEFYIKYNLGFRPKQFDFFDFNKKQYIKAYDKKFNPEINDISLSKALKFLQKQNLPISISLNEIDIHRKQKLESVGIESKRWTKYSISERISIARNSMLHGENHSFQSIGTYLLMIYILFHLHEQKSQNTV